MTKRFALWGKNKFTLGKGKKVKLFTCSVAAIVFFSGCSNLPKSQDEEVLVRKTFERVDPKSIEVKLQDGFFKLMENGLEISSNEKRYGFYGPTVKANQGRSRVYWSCMSEFHETYPLENHKCVVEDFAVVVFRQLPDGKLVLRNEEGGRDLACYGFSEGRRMSCDEYDNSRELRLAKAMYMYSFKQAEDLNNYSGFIESYSKNDLGGLIPIAVERQSKIDKANKEKSRILAEGLKKERAEKIAFTKKYRLELKPGDESNCGLVVDVKRPIVNIQSMNGLVWLKIDEIYPVGMVGCQFLNNVHVHHSPF